MDEDGHSALDWACNNGHLDTVEYLLYRGVNPFITDRFGRNALHWAARGPQMSVVGYLLALGMSPETPDHDGSTVLEMSKTNQALKDTIHSPAHACGYRAGATMGPSSVFINDRLSRIIPRERDDQLTKNDMAQKNIDLQGKHITELVRISLDDIPNINPNNHSSLCTELKVDNSSLIYGVHPSILRKNRLRIPYFAFFSLFTFFLGCIVLFTKWYISFTIFLLIGLIAFIINRGQKFLKRNTMPNGDIYEQNEANKNEALGIVGVICDTIASKYGARAVGLIGRLLQAHERLIGFWFGMCMVFGLIIFGGWIVHFRAERGVPEHLQLFVLEFIGESISEVFPYFIITTTSYIFTVISWFLLFTVYYDPGIVYISRAASYCSMLDSVNTTGLTPSRDSWCTATFHVKPFRAKYDAPTGLLVARFDHHCPWLNNAIGHRNHRIYIVFLFWHLLFMYSTLVWGLMTSLNEVKIEDTFLTRCELSERLLSRRVYGVVVVMLCSLLFGTGLTILFFLQIRNILENVTTNERINWRRYPYMKGAIDEMKFMNMNHDQFHNRFDTGSKWNNWKEFWLHQVDYYDSYNIPQGKHEEYLDDGDRSVSSDQQREDAASSTFATMM